MCITPPVQQGGTNADYLFRRLARDAPGILERVKAGEFKSARAAAPPSGGSAGIPPPRPAPSLTCGGSRFGASIRLEAHDIAPVKFTPTSRKAGSEHVSRTVSAEAIAAADRSIMHFDASAYQAPGAASNDPARDKGETFRNTQPLAGKSSAVGPLGLFSL